MLLNTKILPSFPLPLKDQRKLLLAKHARLTLVNIEPKKRTITLSNATDKVILNGYNRRQCEAAQDRYPSPQFIVAFDGKLTDATRDFLRRCPALNIDLST